MNTVTFTAPSAWASYLINGDASGMEIAEKATADAWIYSVGRGSPVGCEPAGFRWVHDASAFAPAADCELYTFKGSIAEVNDAQRRINAACSSHVPQHGTEDCRQCGRSLLEHGS